MKRHKQEQKENPEQIEYREAFKDMKDAELRMALRGRGLDPYELSQKDFDELRRLINKMQQVDAATKGKINVVQQEGNQEQMEISRELEAIIQKVFNEQHPGLQEKLQDTAVPSESLSIANTEPSPETGAPVQEGVTAGSGNERGLEA